MPRLDKTVIIGAGGNGSWLTLFLTQHMFHNEQMRGHDLFIVDHDRFEERNRARQFFARPGNKAESLVGTYTMRYEGQLSRMKAIPKMVVGYDDFDLINGVETISVDGVVNNYTLVFLCVDRYYPRLVVSRRAQSLHSVCVINGGTGRMDWGVDVYIKDQGQEITPPLEKLHPEIVELAELEKQDMARNGLSRNENACTLQTEGEEVAQTLVSNISTATLMFQVYSAFLAGKLTNPSFEGSVFANQNGSWGPALRWATPPNLEES